MRKSSLPLVFFVLLGWSALSAAQKTGRMI